MATADNTSVSYDGYITMRDEIVLRTACGCEKIVSARTRGFSDSIGVAITEETPPYRTRPWTLDGDMPVRRSIRRFDYCGELDRSGRRLYREVIPEPDLVNWKQKYQDLYQEVYGMDRGL